MSRYELHKNAGTVNYADWQENKGIKIPIFDIDGTLTEHKSLVLDNEVMLGLEQQAINKIFPNIAIVSNNPNLKHVEAVSHMVAERLSVNVFSTCIAEGYAKKPNPIMGQVVANHFNVKTENLGIVGDRRISDITFAKKLGAGAMALCAKVGIEDAPFVPLVRIGERVIVVAEWATGRIKNNLLKLEDRQL
ncbi:HAD-IIIA family hydrolase [Candidatus Saccharibacteria bacterium]|jgi:HAD superfamily hydrolase (TIGR01662 family)|nr:HAD-IIIA family hydrolase [Candidatus Saccharibacteria bacterium]HOR23532.1 HAD-IIIA family hydrolase [Candidatus Saccharibacteria bacterium]HPW47893.1 HAD-IIIA family hydrolase [Candidatus Saccharibacteria bacterium]